MKKAKAEGRRRVKALSSIRLTPYFTEPFPGRKDATDPTVHTEVRIKPTVNVGAVGGWLRFWVAGREVRIGPLTAEQAEKLSEDLLDLTAEKGGAA